MASEEPEKDSREYLKEVVRSNGRLGTFWARGSTLCVQIRHPMLGNIRFLVEPDSFGGRGCIFDAVGPRHQGDPFGWQRIGFAGFSDRLQQSAFSKLARMGRRSASEARTFVNYDEPVVRWSLTPAHYLIADKAPAAALDLVQRIRELNDRLMIDGKRSLSESLLERGSGSDPMFPFNIISIYDLVGEAAIFKALFGNFLRGPEMRELDRIMTSVKTDIQSVSDSLDKYAFDIAVLNFTLGVLETYIMNLSRLTSKASILSVLTRPAMVSFYQEIYYRVLEARTVAENVAEGSRFLGHPRDLNRWIAEFRFHDYALRELLDKGFKASPSIYASPRELPLFYRHRFAYPPEIDWWMWHSLEKETGLALERAFGFDAREIFQKTGVRPGPIDEVTTPLKPKSLLKSIVEILITDSPFDQLHGVVITGLKVLNTTKSEFDEEAYYLAAPVEPITITPEPEKPITIHKVRFGSSLPRSPPQAIRDEGFNALMKSDPYKRVIVDVSAALSSEAGPDDLLYLGFGALGLVEIGNPSIFEVQRYRLVQEYMEKKTEDAKVWEVDYAR